MTFEIQPRSIKVVQTGNDQLTLFTMLLLSVTSEIQPRSTKVVKTVNVQLTLSTLLVFLPVQKPQPGSFSTAPQAQEGAALTAN